MLQLSACDCACAVKKQYVKLGFPGAQCRYCSGEDLTGVWFGNEFVKYSSYCGIGLLVFLQPSTFLANPVDPHWVKSLDRLIVSAQTYCYF